MDRVERDSFSSRMQKGIDKVKEKKHTCTRSLAQKKKNNNVNQLTRVSMSRLCSDVTRWRTHRVAYLAVHNHQTSLACRRTSSALEILRGSSAVSRKTSTFVQGPCEAKIHRMISPFRLDISEKNLSRPSSS